VLILACPPDEGVLIELKTFPANYGAPGKPITNFVDGVIEDLHKLTGGCDELTVGIAVWIAYRPTRPSRRLVAITA
jgi:hypothetical protein